jgi:hypothetical protein
VCAVLIPDAEFRRTEMYAAASIAAFIPDDKAEAFKQRFTEFKGSDLFGGFGAFDGIDEKDRFKIIYFLLNMVGKRSPIIFGAVNKAQWTEQSSKDGPLFAYGGSHVDEISFRDCLLGIGTYIKNNAPESFALVISDDVKEAAVKDRLRSAFLAYRERLDTTRAIQPMPFLHDDMYFGNSQYSIGIQLADLCGFFISKRLEHTSDPNANRFFDMIDRQIMYSRIEPEGKDVNQHICEPDRGMRSGL